MADALDSGSSEQYAHVGSSPVPRTTKSRKAIIATPCKNLRGVCFTVWRDLNGRESKQSIRIVCPPRRDSASNSQPCETDVSPKPYAPLHCERGASPVPRTIVKVAVRLLNSRERELHEALFSSTSKSLITLDLGYILGYVQRITTNSRSARHLWNERARRSF